MSAEFFGGRLRELREAAGLTLQQLADKAGVHLKAISKLQAGNNEPKWSTVIALADALGVSTEEFRKRPARRAAPGPGRPRKK